MNYGDILYQIRKAKGLSQMEMADICNITQAGYSKIEKGANMKVPVQLLAELVKQLNVNPYAFIHPNEPLFAKAGSDSRQMRSKLRKYETRIEQLFKMTQEND